MVNDSCSLAQELDQSIIRARSLIERRRIEFLLARPSRKRDALCRELRHMREGIQRLRTLQRAVLAEQEQPSSSVGEKAA